MPHATPWTAPSASVTTSPPVAGGADPRRLRVTHVLQHLAVGGLERVVEHLALEARHLGISPSVVAYESDGPLRERLAAADIPCVLLTPRRRSGLRPELSMHLAGALRDLGTDVVHSHHLGPFLYAAPVARTLGLGHVHTEHSVEFYDRPRRRLLGRFMHRQARVVAVSDAVADFHARHLGGLPEVVVNGVPLPAPTTPRDRACARVRLGLPSDAFVIGAVARLAPEKDLATLFRACQRLARLDASAGRPPVHLVLAGDGPERAELERLARSDDQLSTHVLGARNDVPQLWPAFDLVALSSQREGLPMALLEGMAAGLPAVATAVGGVPELVDGSVGAVVPAGDSDGMAREMAKLRDDPAHLARCGVAARARIDARYGIGPMVAAYAHHWAATRPDLLGRGRAGVTA